MKHSFLFRILTVLIILPLFFSCKKGNNHSHTFYGPPVSMGDGIARSFFEVGADGNPLTIGVELTKDALQDLPAGPTSETVDFVEYPLLFDSKIQPLIEALTPFKHLILNWEPHGHPPVGVFTFPHIDFHFYMISPAERLAIPEPSPTTIALFDAAPPAGYLPIDYTIPGALVAQMGKHWLDHTMPELPPTLQPFTHVLIYGSYNTKVAFLEPMVRRDFLLSGTEVHKAIKQPANYDQPGKYYPTRYNIHTSAETNKIYFTMDQFVLR
jgi:hypothetical protein